jgi:hypothetical protein
MSHFAKINENNMVIQVITAEQDFINSGVVGDSFLWIQTSYNNNFRKQFATIGDTYDIVKNKFIKSKPYYSWILNANDDWESPVPYPDDDKRYEWDEETTNWKEMV